MGRETQQRAILILYSRASFTTNARSDISPFTYAAPTHTRLPDSSREAVARHHEGTTSLMRISDSEGRQAEVLGAQPYEAITRA